MQVGPYSSAFQVPLVVKNTPANVGHVKDVCSMSGLDRFPGEGNGNLLQYAWVENPVDKGAWLATVHGVIKSQTQLGMHVPYL